MQKDEPSGLTYAASGVDIKAKDEAAKTMVGLLSYARTGLGRPLGGSGHFAGMVEFGEHALVLATDGVGTKLEVANHMRKWDTVGIDCIAMNVNDVVCVGADPIAVLDYIAVEEARDDVLEQVGVGLKAGAEDAGVEIPGGELAVVPELIRGHPSPSGLDLVGMCVGLVDLDAVLTGARAAPGDAVVGLPSSGVHSNGYTLARRALPALDEAPEQLGGATVGEALLEPTLIYVRAARELLASEVDVRGLAHITGDGLLNLLRLESDTGYRIDSPLPVPPLFDLIAERGQVGPEELYEVFNMGCGFCCVVAAEHADLAVAQLSERHPGTAVIGEVTDRSGLVEMPGLGLSGRAGQGFAAA